MSTKGNEYFCYVDPEFILDRFNLTGINFEAHRLRQTIALITDTDVQPEIKEEDLERLEKSARHLYGLIHARFILTTRGLQKMADKYRNFDFGRCPRVHCNLHPLLPIGLEDSPNHSSVKLYCSKCEDIYVPKSSRHATIDGAYFGTSFPGMLFQVYPHLTPTKPKGHFVPKIFGFKIHEYATLARWQKHQRQEMEKRIEEKKQE